LFGQIGIFLLELLRTRNGASANFFNKIFQFDTQKYIAKSSSLNSFGLAPYSLRSPAGKGDRGER
jgi:hypothetical protein